MPLVEVKVIEGVFTDTDKQQMIEKITDVMVGIGGEGLRSHTYVIVEDVKSGAWGIGGSSITTDMVNQMASREPVMR